MFLRNTVVFSKFTSGARRKRKRHCNPSFHATLPCDPIVAHICIYWVRSLLQKTESQHQKKVPLSLRPHPPSSLSLPLSPPPRPPPLSLFTHIFHGLHRHDIGRSLHPAQLNAASGHIAEEDGNRTIGTRAATHDSITFASGIRFLRKDIGQYSYSVCHLGTGTRGPTTAMCFG